MAKSSTSFSPAQLAAAASAQTAASTGTPSVVLDAFEPEPIRAGKIELRPFTLATFMFMERINSPLVKNTNTEPTTDDIAVAVFVLANPLTEVRRLWRQGKEDFDEAVFQFADTVPAAHLALIGQKIQQYLEAAFATVQSSGDLAPEKKSDGKSAEPSQISTLTPPMPSPESLRKTPDSAGP